MIIIAWGWKSAIRSKADQESDSIMLDRYSRSQANWSLLKIAEISANKFEALPQDPKKIVNLNSSIISQKDSKTCITKIIKRRSVHIYFNIPFRGDSSELTSNMMLVSGTEGMDHRIMIREYCVNWCPIILLLILKYIFVSSLPNLKAC